MPKWTEYTSKDTLADNDEVMLYDATARANKRGLMSKFWDYVVDKMSTAVISKLETNNKTIIGAINALNSDSLKWQRYAVFDGVIKVKNIYTLANKGEGVLLANISAYNTPSITEQYLYIIGFSADRGDANFHKIVGDGETISSVTCTGNSIVLNLTSGYSSAICRVLFIGN